jgi:hypothetical protein
MLFEFVWEAEFEHSLSNIEPCLHCAERLMRRIEYRCLLEVTRGSQGYGLVRFSWHFQRLVTWYVVVSPTITVVDIKRDLGIYHGRHRNAA